MADATSSPTAASSKRAVRTLAAIGIVTAIAMLALVGWAIWTASRAPAPPPAPRFDRYRPAWESAMSKAAVEATFPAEPVRFAQLRYSGRHSFEATFTADEISALLSVYRHQVKMQGEEVELGSASVEFPTAGRVELTGLLLTGGSSYQAQVAAPVSFRMGNIRTPGLTSLVVEGFTVRGSRREQAERLLVEYFNRYIDAAPGLSVDSAAVVDGGLRVRGFAADSLEPLSQ